MIGSAAETATSAKTSGNERKGLAVAEELASVAFNIPYRAGGKDKHSERGGCRGGQSFKSLVHQWNICTVVG
ncbi:hypothetical protein AAE026_29520 [Bradyrhizobium sp. DN5]|uniref:hypothetical protein n=1 Tax=Bradyrhizobium sp. DN5 TaxID=3056950 RepID=UPI003524666C